MTDMFPIDPETLAALSRTPNTDLDEPTAREIAWAASYGPATPEDALRILASPRARRSLTREWAHQCPTPDLLDTLLNPASPDEDAELHAHAVRALLTLHTRTCPTCTTHLHQLRDDLDDLDHDLDQIEEAVRSWAVTLTPTSGALTRGEDPGEPMRQELHDPDLYHALTGRPHTATDHHPTLTLTTTPADHGHTQLTTRLLVPAGIQPTVAINVLVHLPTADHTIPLHPTPDDPTIATGHTTTPTWPPTDELTLDIQVTPHEQP